MVVKLLGKEIDIKGGYEDVKGILAELEFSTRPAESRTGGVRVSLEDSVVSDPGIKGKAWEDWRGCDRWCSGRATGGSGSTQSSWSEDQKLRHLEGQKRGDGGRAGRQASILDFFAPRLAKLSLKLERQTSILEFFGPTRGEAEVKTAEAKVAGTGAAEAKPAVANKVREGAEPAPEEEGKEARRRGTGTDGSGGATGRAIGGKPSPRSGLEKGKPGLINTLKQAGLDSRGELQAPLAHESGKDSGAIGSGHEGREVTGTSPTRVHDHDPFVYGDLKKWLDGLHADIDRAEIDCAVCLEGNKDGPVLSELASWLHRVGKDRKTRFGEVCEALLKEGYGNLWLTLLTSEEAKEACRQMVP